MLAYFAINLVQQGYLVGTNYNTYKRRFISSIRDFKNLPVEEKIVFLTKCSVKYALDHLVTKKSFGFVEKNKKYLKSLKQLVKKEAQIVKKINNKIKPAVNLKSFKKTLMPTGEALKDFGEIENITRKHGKN